MTVRDLAGMTAAALLVVACARPSIPPPAPAGRAATPPAPPSRPALLPRTLNEPAAPPAAPLPPVRAAEIRFTDLAGLRRELDTLRARHRPVLVNFWATWCGACAQELPLLGDLAREWGDAGPVILGVSLDHLTVPDDDRIMGRVRQMLSTRRVSYPNRIIRGDQHEVFDAYGIDTGIPVSIFYDGRGDVVRRYTGPVPVEEARAIARSLAAGQAVGS